MLFREEVLSIIALLYLQNCRGHSELQHQRNATFPVMSEWIDNLLKNGYDRSRTPTHSNKGLPTRVKIGIYVETLGNFQATSMDYDLDIYFKEWWQDERLKHQGVDLPGFNELDLINKIWRPDVYFANSKLAHTNLLTAPNTYMHIAENGSIFYSLRVNLKLSCAMDFRNYPLDRQICTIKIISYGYTVNEMVATWDDFRAAVAVNPDNEASELGFVKVETIECDGRYPIGVYSCLEARFHLDRHVTFYLIQNYIPTGLIVCVSWISFWIDPSSVPGRVTLAISTLLTIATQSSAIMQKLPPVTYTKAIDVWLGACMIFVFGTLLEYACVNSFRRTERERAKLDDERARNGIVEKSRPTFKHANGIPHVMDAKAPVAEPECLTDRKRAESLAEMEGLVDDGSIIEWTDWWRTLEAGIPVRNTEGYSKARQLDRVCRVAFPIAWIAFNAAYWLKYWYFGTMVTTEGES